MQIYAHKCKTCKINLQILSLDFLNPNYVVYRYKSDCVKRIQKVIDIGALVMTIRVTRKRNNRVELCR